MATTPTCPKCSTSLKDDYGMVTCPACAVVLFVDMDGVAHAAGDEQLVDSPAIVTADPESFDLEIASANTPPDAPPDIHLDIPSVVRAGVQGEELNMEAFLGYDAATSEDNSNENTLSQSDPNDPLGISAYANSELSSAKDGSFVVTVTISGIDTKDLRSEIRQALQDSRFGWDASSVMSAIRGGTLRLERINPVKATIVVNRIKNLAVQIRWEQSAITELEIPEDSAT